jgi:hypothetical protein
MTHVMDGDEDGLLQFQGMNKLGKKQSDATTPFQTKQIDNN